MNKRSDHRHNAQSNGNQAKPSSSEGRERYQLMHGEEPLGQGGTNSCCCCRINSTNIHKLSCISSISTTTTSTSSSSTRTNNSANPHCNIGKDRKRKG